MEAVYTAPDKVQKFHVDENSARPPADTTRDAVEQPDESTPLGLLRAQVLSVQHQLNVFLTQRMEEAKQKANTAAVEQPIEESVEANDENDENEETEEIDDTIEDDTEA